MQERRTGRLEWKHNGCGWDLMEEVEVGDYVTRIYKLHTPWWVWRFAPMFRYEVMHIKTGGNPVRNFWSLKKAKAYAEVCYRMGVEPQ